MATFLPQHTPTDADQFTQGYLSCVEWLLPESDHISDPPPRERLRGFHPHTIRKAVAVCRDFQDHNSRLLLQYIEHSGRTLYTAGTDFFLSRNGHGAGFFDRGCAPCFALLQKASRVYCETSEYLDQEGLIHSE